MDRTGGGLGAVNTLSCLTKTIQTKQPRCKSLGRALSSQSLRKATVLGCPHTAACGTHLRLLWRSFTARPSKRVLWSPSCPLSLATPTKNALSRTFSGVGWLSSRSLGGERSPLCGEDFVENRLLVPFGNSFNLHPAWWLTCLPAKADPPITGVPVLQREAEEPADSSL